MKKRFWVLAAMLLTVLLFLTSCSSGIKSTEEQARVIGECGGYDVKYEELRFLTLTCKAELASKYGENIFSDTSSEWVGDYSKELEDMVKKQLCQNYASLIVFKENRIKPTDSETKSYVNSCVESIIESFESEEEYLAYLEECYMTDAVLRSNSALESCFYRYYEKIAKELDEEAYNAVMNADGFIRTMSIFIKNDDGEDVDRNRRDAEKVHAEILAGAPLSSYIGTKYNQDTGTCDYYFMKGYFDEAYEEAAFALEIGEISPIVETDEGFYIIQRMELSDTYMLGNIEALKSIYFECKMYETINKLADELAFEFNDFGKSIDLWTME